MSKKPESRSAFPLAWPDHWPRTKAPSSAQFKTSIAGALDNVRKSVAAFGRDSGKPVTDLLISSNVSLGDQNPRDPGVAIYFTWDGIPTCMAVDRYARVEHNLQAIHHVLEAERTKLRHGGLNLVRAAFQGYAKLPPPSAFKDRPWHEVLAVPPSATLAEAKVAYQRARSMAHPDKSGSAAAFEEVQRAWAAAETALSPRP